MLNKLFDADNPFMRAMSRIFDAAELNLLWLVCCVPVVTAGASTAALYDAMLGLVRGEETRLHLDFFRSFRRNFRRGVLLGLLLALAGGFLELDVYLAYRAGTGVYTFFMVFFGVLFLLWACVSLYAFPLLARLGNPVLKTLALAFLLSLRHLPHTLLMLAAAVFALWLCHLLPVLALVVFGLLAEFQCTLLAAILKPLLPGGAQEGQAQ